MDAPTLTSLIGEMNQANTGGKSDDVVNILGRLKSEVQPTEDLLRSSKAGVAVGKLRSSDNSQIASLAKDVVKIWKDVIEENKKKRKRDEGGDKDKERDDTKRVKAEGSSSKGSPATASPAAPAETSGDQGSPDRKPKVERTLEPPTNNSTAKSSPAPPSPPRKTLSTIDESRTVMRTHKSDGMTDKLKAVPDDGDDVRVKCVGMIYDALAGDSTADKKILAERAVSIERATWELLKQSTGNDYRAKIRSLFLNLKDKGNPALRNEIVLGEISADKVTSMSKEEMASESVRALNEKIANENLFKAKAVGETQAETDAFKCGRCFQRKCTYYQMQTRSADEPMTTFVTCTNCGNRWKFS